jgi:hypothetical protein
MHLRFLVILGLFFAGTALAVAQTASLSGEWLVELRQDDDTRRFQWRLDQAPDGRLSGTGPGGRTLQGHVKGRTVRVEQSVPAGEHDFHRRHY